MVPICLFLVSLSFILFNLGPHSKGEWCSHQRFVFPQCQIALETSSKHRQVCLLDDSTGNKIDNEHLLTHLPLVSYHGHL